MTEAWENRMTPERIVSLGRRDMGKSDPWAVEHGAGSTYAAAGLRTLHKRAVDAAVTAALDSLAEELDALAQNAQETGEPARHNAYHFAASLARKRIPVPF